MKVVVWVDGNAVFSFRTYSFDTLFCVQICAVIIKVISPSCVRLLCNDPAVLAMVPLVPVLICCVVGGTMLVLEGVLVTIGKLQLGMCSSVFSSLVGCAAMIGVEQVTSLSATAKLHGYWYCIAGFMSLRLIINSIGVATALGEERGNGRSPNEELPTLVVGKPASTGPVA